MIRSLILPPRRVRLLVFLFVAIALGLTLSSPGLDFVQAWPGADNSDFGRCGEPATLISKIQGRGTSTPLAGIDVVIEGVVVGDFQEDNGFSGFFVQEEDADTDDDEMTSEGIFVYDKDFVTNVEVGQVVRVKGKVQEHHNLTELELSSVHVCPGSPPATAVKVNLPFDGDTFLERYEGMLVTFPQKLTVSNNYELGEYGQVVLSDGRLMQPTNVVAPGQEANELQEENDLNRLLLDDGSKSRHPDPIAYPAPALSASNTLRVGDTISNLTGVLHYRYDDYRIQPREREKVTFTPVNTRSAEPEPLGGSLKVAGFNLGNYFNGDGLGGGFRSSRGARNWEEFKRQRAKIVSAIVAMEADVVGLVEIEEDGYGKKSAVHDLVRHLNKATCPGAYSFIDPGFDISTDQIKVGIIYRPGTVRPVGSAATTTESPFTIPHRSRRQPLAQTFEELETGERFTVVVNHFKSKRCGSAEGLNADQGDGQACWNAERTEAARTLTEWLATDPTSSNDPDFLIIGDLNAYAKEDPITAIKDAGYTDLIDDFVGEEDAYSYVYYSQSGYVDHALASESLRPQVKGATIWHINADEPRALDYKPEEQEINSLYSEDPYRSSDHDPVIIGLDLHTG